MDLNLRVQLAVAGLTDDPCADIAALLRSGVPIETRTRRRIADALERKSTVHLKAVFGPDATNMRIFRKRLVRLWTGRLALERAELIGYDRAAAQTAADCGISEKSTMACMAFARRLDGWKAALRSSDPRYADFDDRALEVAYLYADAFKKPPEEALKPALSELARLIEDYEGLMQDSVGIARDWQARPKRRVGIGPKLRSRLR